MSWTRMGGLRFVISAALFANSPSAARSAEAQGVPATPPLRIGHEEIACVAAGTFPRFEARVTPAETVARARIHFRAAGGSVWYFVEMMPGTDVFRGVLPKPKRTTLKMEYYIEAVARDAAITRTPTYTPDVVAGRAMCDRRKNAPAGQGETSLVKVDAPVGAPLVPLGFEGTGIAGAPAGLAPAAASVGAGGGLSGKALAIGGVAVAAGLGIAFAAGGESAPRPNGEPPAATDLTGRWIGFSPDGWIVTTNAACNTAYDFFLDLSQSGGTLTGSGRLVLRQTTVTPPDCSPVGTDLGSNPLTGAVSGATVTLNFVSPFDSDPYVLTGTFTTTRMSGTFTRTSSSRTGTWAVNRQ